MIANTKDPSIQSKISNVELPTRINLKYFGKLQKLQGYRIGDSCQYMILLEVDEFGYTFAIGRAKCGQGIRF